MSRLPPAAHGALQKGVSLIEVLVALLVVSLGVLAMSGLLGTASRFGKTSEYRAVATLLAADLADRMRANAAAAADGDYDLEDEYSGDEPSASDFACSVGDPCSRSEMADKDLAEWRMSLHEALPGGAGYVQVFPDLKVADLWVAWMDPDESPDAAYTPRAGDAGGARQECPPGFADTAPLPRCLFFRVPL